MLFGTINTSVTLSQNVENPSAAKSEMLMFCFQSNQNNCNACTESTNSLMRGELAASMGGGDGWNL